MVEIKTQFDLKLRKLIKNKKALSLAGNPKIAFDQLEIFERKKKRIIKSSLHSINGIKTLSKEAKTIIENDLKKITSKLALKI